MQSTKTEKREKTISGLVAEKTGFTADYVRKVSNGIRRNEVIEREYSHLMQLLENFKNQDN
jgi:hypothetical protein